MDSLISIIVPIYNAESYIGRCIESILQQTYKNIQLILINDGSKDKSLDVCNYYGSIDSRITVIDKPNEGAAATRNLGIKLAQGDFIGFVDSDDYIEKNMYEILVKQIIKDDSQACALTAYTINSFDKYKSNYKDNVIEGKDAINYLFSLSFPTSLWAYLYKKELVKNNYLNEQIHFFEDFEFNFRALKNASKISLCHEKLYNYIINEGSINSQKINDKRITSLNIYNLIIDEIKNDHDSQLIKQTAYFRSAFLIGVILSLSKSRKEAEQKYYNIVYKHAKGMIKDILFSSYVPLKYKAVISMCVINTHIACNLISLFR